MNLHWPVEAEDLVAIFDSATARTMGLEEEIMILDPETLDLLPIGAQLLQGLDPGRFKTEMPASQIEIATRPFVRLDDLQTELCECRQVLVRHVGKRARLASAGVHPFADRFGELNGGERYERLQNRYADILRQQLVCGLHLHLGMGGARRSLAVYNAMRSFLPEIAALAANAPIYCGRDTTMASVRPLISGLLPRQGIPPVIDSWQEYSRWLEWAIATGSLAGAGEWWWELRLHGALGTLEIRVADSQRTVADAVAVATVAAGIACWLGDRYDCDELPEPAETWAIEENRWAAARHGLSAPLVNLETGSTERAGERLQRLIDEVAPAVEQLGGAGGLHRARELAEVNGAARQRSVFDAEGPVGLAEWLTAGFLPGGNRV